ncbi:MAG TPA: hypothetical protein DCX53_15815 [Anaerolineae bacterium]|nr:hypothetical protein [Anaerolineae bacterium]
MNTSKASVLTFLFMVSVVLSACSFSASELTPVSSDTPAPTATITNTPTNTPRPSPTPRPTKTPDLAATQKYNEFNAEAQKYFDLGYLSTGDGRFQEFEDFYYEWAQLGWYQPFIITQNAEDFYISAHFSWESAFRNADDSGCGFAFAINNGGHYSVFLDRTKIVFLDADASYGSYALSVGRTRGSGRVKFENPAEADFTLIINDAYAYVLVDGEVIGEYTLSQSRNLRGDIALTVLSGTNKDYGTRCEMTNIRMFRPQ